MLFPLDGIGDTAHGPRAGGRTPRTPAGGGGAHVAQGPHVTYGKKFSSFFNVFKTFVKIFVHDEIGTVVTYLTFEFSFQHVIFT